MWQKRNAESNGDQYDYHIDYDLNFNQGIPSPDFKSQPAVKRSANNRDMAFYYADQVWQQIKSAGYNAYPSPRRTAPPVKGMPMIPTAS